MILVLRGFFVIAALWLTAVPAHAAALAVVLALDVSASVTADSYILQRDGIAHAFADPRLARAIAAAPGGIEALVLEWSDPQESAVTVGWTRIADSESAARFAAAIHATSRTSHGLTAIGPALAAAAAQFGRLPQPAARRVIDISGDGMANLGLPPAAMRDAIVKAGITINGLAILSEEPWLEGYYRKNVIGGPGAFVAAARDFGNVADAMLRKLAVEVAGASVPRAASVPLSSSGPPALLGQVGCWARLAATAVDPYRPFAGSGCSRINAEVALIARRSASAGSGAAATPSSKPIIRFSQRSPKY